jgi:hypothetical protein
MKANADSPRLMPGTFFLTFPDRVEVHLLSTCALAGYRQGYDVTDRSRDPEAARAKLRRQVFRVEGSLAALPADTLQALGYYMSEYNGPAADTVRGYAAALMLGRAVGTEDHRDNGNGGGGTKVTSPKPAPKGPCPGGAVFTAADLLQAVQS